MTHQFQISVKEIILLLLKNSHFLKCAEKKVPVHSLSIIGQWLPCIQFPKNLWPLWWLWWFLFIFAATRQLRECAELEPVQGRVQMPPPLPGAWWWLEMTEITETYLGLGIWVRHDVKSTNKIYCFKQKNLSVRNKEQKMSLFVSLHTFVEKPVRFEAPQMFNPWW